MMTDEEAIEQLTTLYKLTSPIAYKKKHKNCREKLLKLIKKIRKHGLESVTKEDEEGLTVINFILNDS